MRVAGLLWLVGFLVVLPAYAGGAKNVAVVVYAQSAGLDERAVTRIAQNRVERILGENGVTVLDQEMLRELKKSWRMLEDSNFLPTVEDFAEVARKYRIDGIYRVYVRAQTVAAPAQLFSAAARVDFQLVDEDTLKVALPKISTGAIDSLPSDGPTASVAMINAVQQAVDSSLGKAGYNIDDVVVPGKLDFELKPVDVAAIGMLDTGMVMRRIPADTRQLPGSLLGASADATERYTDEFACLAQSPDNIMIAAGIRVRTQFRMYLKWHTMMRLVDVTKNKLVKEFEVDKGIRRGTTKMLDCMFVNNWRYLVAVTGNTLVMWDTERGRVMSKIDLVDRSLESASLAYYRARGGWFLVIEGNDARRYAFQFVMKDKKASTLQNVY